MSLANELNHELLRIAQAGCSAANPQQATVAVPGGQLSVELVGIDTIACSFLRLATQLDRLANAAIDDLKRISEQLASRINYLLEPIQPVEVDRDQCVVQLRSNPPQRGDDGSTYYELLARRGELSLVRWKQVRGAARTVVQADVTREVLGRLAADFLSFA